MGCMNKNGKYCLFTASGTALGPPGLLLSQVTKWPEHEADIWCEG